MVSHAGEGRTVVLSSHQTEDITALCCQRVVVMHEGRVRFAGTPAALVAQAAGGSWLDRTRGRRRAGGLAHR